MIKIAAHAKINLYLNVLNKREDGYHNLEMIMQSIGLFDTLVFEKAADLSLSSRGLALPPPEENQIILAARAFFKAAGIAGGALIRTEKRIPIMAGLGGASADGAATLFALNELYGKPFSTAELLVLAKTLGADTPFSLLGGTMHATGIGETLSPVSSAMGKLWFAILKPPAGVATKTAFALFDQSEKPPAPPVAAALAAVAAGDSSAYASAFFNALTPAAIAICPGIEKTLAFLAETKPLVSFMTGSGSACIGVYESREEALSALARPERPEGFCFCTQAAPAGLAILERSTQC